MCVYMYTHYINVLMRPMYTYIIRSDTSFPARENKCSSCVASDTLSVIEDKLPPSCASSDTLPVSDVKTMFSDTSLSASEDWSPSHHASSCASLPTGKDNLPPHAPSGTFLPAREDKLQPSTLSDTLPAKEVETPFSASFDTSLPAREPYGEWMMMMSW